MYSQLSIVVMIDVEAALAANSPEGNFYLMDNNRRMGSTGQGTGNLTTTVAGTQIVNWLVTGIDFSGQQPMPALIGIGGEAVERQIMVPQLFDSPALDGYMGYWWGGTVDANVPGIYTYTMTVSMGDKTMQLQSSLNVQAGFTMESPKLTSSLKSVSAVNTLKANAIADGSLMNPANHVSMFPNLNLKNILANQKK